MLRHLLFTTPIFYIVISSGFAGLSLASYYRLSDEKPIASLYFTPKGKQHYQAHLTIGEQAPSTAYTYEILGDQWRIDAYFIKLAAWANVFGADAKYNLERLEGRYQSIEVM